MIRMENISKVYRLGKVEVNALTGVNLGISRGEMVAIVGASGSGKSSLLNIIGCLDRPTAGKYFLDGADVSRLGDNRLAEIRNRKLGFVFQDFNLLPRATALANVELPLIYGNGHNKRARAEEALEKVGLKSRLKHKPTELSGGEQQRVAIARALVNNPAVILADEPTGNLDSVSAEEIVAIFKKLNGEGITVVMITHEVDIARQAQRIVRLKDGHVISDQQISPGFPEGEGKA